MNVYANLYAYMSVPYYLYECVYVIVNNVYESHEKLSRHYNKQNYCAFASIPQIIHSGLTYSRETLNSWNSDLDLVHIIILENCFWILLANLYLHQTNVSELGPGYGE